VIAIETPQRIILLVAALDINLRQSAQARFSTAWLSYAMSQTSTTWVLSFRPITLDMACSKRLRYNSLQKPYKSLQKWYSRTRNVERHRQSQVTAGKEKECYSLG
jgi:hypothetical protein